ncbi:hypothetical protein ACPEEZ_05040 [Frigoribacterium sp. 2-23]|uniref:hypothetical protein n=1 Tax=Frigoribacterium sp. 2-23 TaxID=3415006 RepID=UPI003C702620
MSRTQLQVFLSIVSFVVILHEVADILRPGGELVTSIVVIAAMVCMICLALQPERTRGPR